MKRRIYLFMIALLIFIGCEDNESAEQENENKSSLIFEIKINENTGENYFVNPYDHVPMTAGINFLLTDEKQESSVSARVAIKSTKNQTDFVKEYSFSSDSANSQWLPIIGMYEGENEVQVVVKEKSNQKVLHDTTYSIKLEIPAPDIGRANEAYIVGNFPGDEMIFVLNNTSQEGRVKFTGIVYDSFGNIRWYSAIPNSYLQFVIDDLLYVGFKGEKINRLEIYDFFGRKKNEWEFSGYEDIHHDVLKNDKGNIVLTVSKDDNSPVEDRLIELNPNTIQSDKVVNSIDLSKIFPNVDELFYDLPQLQIGGSREDHVHNNSVSFYKRNGQTIYICSSQRSGIGAVDENGYPHWYFFPKNVQYSDFNDKLSAERLPADGSFPSVDYSESPSYAKLLVNPINKDGTYITDLAIIDEGKVKADNEFIYPFRQHGARVIDYGENYVTFLVLDNALFQGFEPYKNDAFSRAVCYKVTFSGPTQIYGGNIEQLWSTNMDFFAPFLGDSRKTPKGNYIFTFGTIGSTAITTGDGFDYKNDLDTEKISIIVELNSSGYEQGRLVIPSSDQARGIGTYRAQRLNLNLP